MKQVCPICEAVFWPTDHYTVYCSDHCAMTGTRRGYLTRDLLKKSQDWWQKQYGPVLTDNRRGQPPVLTCLNCARLRVQGSAFCSVECVQKYYERIPND